jgi:hypothetical protein
MPSASTNAFLLGNEASSVLRKERKAGAAARQLFARNTKETQTRV